ncbi:MAG: TetR/AcrR family transcriptional regulator [Ferruginibacter sp.]
MVKKKKQQEAGTEAKVLQAARKVFLAKGMEGARMQDIADEAGINKAMLHYYFRDKDKLFETVFIEEAQKFFPKINIIFQADIPLFEKIEKFVAEYIDEMIANPFLPWFVMNEINRNPEQFISKVWGKTSLPKPLALLEQIQGDVKKGKIKKVHPLHLLMNILSMTVFPFVAKPMMTKVLQMNDAAFMQAMQERKKEIPKFIIESIKK